MPRWSADPSRCLGKLADGTPVFDRIDSHLAAHPEAAPWLEEALSRLDLSLFSGGMWAGVVDFGCCIGTSRCVSVSCDADIVYGRRPGRLGWSRFVREAQPFPVNTLRLVLRHAPESNGCVLVTAFVGGEAPPEPWSPGLAASAYPDAVAFWQGHALVWDPEEVDAAWGTRQEVAEYWRWRGGQPELLFRPARAEDAEAAAALVNRAYRGPQGWTNEAALLEGPRASAADILGCLAQGRLEVALSDDQELVGTVFLELDGASCYLGLLAVHPALQGAGLGGRVMAHAEGLARSWGCSRMRMTVIAQRQELIAYYQRRGYRSTGQRVPFPLDPSVGRPLIEGLELVVLEKQLAATP